MVVGGRYTANGRSEIYDLSGQNLTCPAISDNPIDDGSVGIFINNKALVCGGDPSTSDCFSYDMQVIQTILYTMEFYLCLNYLTRLVIGVKNHH